MGNQIAEAVLIYYGLSGRNKEFEKASTIIQSEFENRKENSYDLSIAHFIMGFLLFYCLIKQFLIFFF